MRAVVSSLLLSASLASAQVVHDNTLGKPAGPAPRSGNTILVQPDRGRIVGDNLFHSFKSFNVDPGGVRFDGPANVSNIIARVTGGQRSTIAGKLESTIPNANFYLINPAGVLFSPGASLDVKGSFTVTTADVLHLKDGGRFNATTPSKSILTTAPPSAFGFLSKKPGPIAIRGTPTNPVSLSPAPDKSLHLVGGDVRIANATFFTTGGVLRIESATAGRVDLRDTDILAFAGTTPGGIDLAGGDVRLADSTITTLDANGPVRIDAGTLRLRRTEVQTFGGRADGLEIAAGAVVIGSPRNPADRSELTADWTSSAAGPSLRIDAGSLRVYDSLVRLRSSAKAGDPGDLYLRADDLRLVASARATILSEAVTSPGGDLLISAGALRVVGGNAVVAAATSLRTDSGAVRIDAGAILVDGRGLLAGIRSLATSKSIDDAPTRGPIEITTGSLHVRHGGTIDTTIFGLETGGDITIRADRIRMRGSHRDFFPTQISTAAGLSDGATLTIDADDVHIADGSYITSSGASGDGGDIRLRARRLVVRGSEFFTGLESSSFGAGRGGEVRVDADVVRLLNGGQLDVDAVASGDAGRIVVRAGELFISGGTPSLPSGLFSSGVAENPDVVRPGDAGDVRVVARAITIAGGGQVASLSVTGRAGDVRLFASGLLRVDAASVSAASPIGGGNISLRSASAIATNRALITARAGRDGGRIDLAAPALALNRSTIDGRSAGTPVAVTIPASTALLLSIDSIILTDALTIPPPLDLSGTLLPLQLRPIDRNARIFDLCAPDVFSDTSTFRLLPPTVRPAPGGWLQGAGPLPEK